MEWLTLVLGCTLLFLLYKIRSESREQKLLSQIPGPNLLTMIYAFCNYVHRHRAIPLQLVPMLFDKCGPVFRLQNILMLKIFVKRPQDAAVILAGKTNPNKSDDYQNGPNFLSQGVIGSNGQVWQDARKIISPIFSNFNLKKMQPKFHKFASASVHDLRSKTSPAFCPRAILNEHVSQLVADTLLNVDLSLENRNDFVTTLRDASEALALRILSYLRIKVLYRFSSTRRNMKKAKEVVKRLTIDIINQWKVKLEQESMNREMDDQTEHNLMTSLEHFITSNKCDTVIGQELIQSHIGNIGAGGIETTTASLSCVLFLLGTYPQHQDEVYREISEVLGQAEVPSMQQLAEMQMLGRCIKESLRIYTLLPLIERKLSEDAKLGDLTIPAGCTVSFSLQELHKDPENWPNPETFDPDRFLPENCERRHPYAYLPFSTGVRVCIGDKFSMVVLKHFLCVILKEFRVEAAMPREDLQMEFNLVSFPKSGYLIRLHDRKPRE